jgi:hypothetical protein
MTVSLDAAFRRFGSSSVFLMRIDLGVTSTISSSIKQIYLMNTEQNSVQQADRERRTMSAPSSLT